MAHKKLSKDNFRARTLATVLVAIVVLFALSILGSYLLSINSINSERTAREQQRAPACELANHSISKLTVAQGRKTDEALYDAIGCPKILMAK